MHAVEMQMQARPAPVEEFKEKPQLEQAKKTDAEPAENGDSFLAMIKKMIAAGKEGSEAENGLGDKAVEKEAGVQDKTGTKDKSENSLSEANALKDGKANRQAKTDDLSKRVTHFEETQDSKNLRSNFADDKKMLNLLLQETEDAVEIKNLLPEDVKESENNLLFSDNKDLKDSLDSKKLKKKDDLEAKNESLATAQNSAKLNKKINKQKSEEAIQTEAKKPVTKSTKPVISVEDLRNPQMQADATVHKAGSETRVETENSVDMVIDFRGKADTLAGDKQAGAPFAQNASKSNASFQSMLAQEIREQAADFVQAGKIVLRNNNAGEIRLQLRPENLGAVRIKLELAEGRKVNGTVTVSTKEAYEAFKEGLDSLAEEFEKNGFDTANFNLNWQGNSSSQQGFGEGSFDNFVLQTNTENLRQTEKTADNLSAYNFVYGESVDILV